MYRKNRDDMEHKTSIEDFMNRGFQEHFTAAQQVTKEFSMQELTDALKIMNGKTSSDPYGLSNKMYKHIGFICNSVGT